MKTRYNNSKQKLKKYLKDKEFSKDIRKNNKSDKKQ